jgi:hypothetical protein
MSMLTHPDLAGWHGSRWKRFSLEDFLGRVLGRQCLSSLFGGRKISKSFFFLALRSSGNSLSLFMLLTAISESRDHARFIFRRSAAPRKRSMKAILEAPSCSVVSWKLMAGDPVKESNPPRYFSKIVFSMRTAKNLNTGAHNLAGRSAPGEQILAHNFKTDFKKQDLNS